MAVVQRPSGSVSGAVARPDRLPPLTNAPARPIPPSALPPAEPAIAIGVAASAPPVPPTAPTAPKPKFVQKSAGELIPTSTEPQVRALKAFFREGVESAPATANWLDTGAAIRHLNYETVLALAALALDHDPQTLLGFMQSSAAALLEIIATDVVKSLTGKPTLPPSQLRELESMVYAIVADVAKTHPQDIEGALTRYVDVARKIYQDPDLARGSIAVARERMVAGDYRVVQSPSDFVARFEHTRHNAHLELVGAVTDTRLMGSTGVQFTYGQKAEDVTAALIERLDAVVLALVTSIVEVGDLPMDRRCSLMQAWTRQAAILMSGKYVSESLRLKAWIQATRDDPAAFRKRIAEANQSCAAVVEQCGVFAQTTVEGLVAQYLPRYAASIEVDPAGEPALSPTP